MKRNLEKRVLILEAALKPFAELPSIDNAGNPVVDLHVNYRGGAGWSMRVANCVNAQQALRAARMAMKGKL